MRMGKIGLKAGWFLVTGALGCLFLCLGPATALAKQPRLSSKKINVVKCPNDGNPGSHRCPSETGYTVVATNTEMSDFRMVLNEESGFQLFLEPAGCEEVRHDPDIELRTFNREPFAVIQRVLCFEPITMVQEKGAPKRKPIATFIVLRGLKGFDKLSKDLKMKGAGGTQKARVLADSFFRRVWPKIAQQRAEAAEAESDE